MLLDGLRRRSGRVFWMRWQATIELHKPLWGVNDRLRVISIWSYRVARGFGVYPHGKGLKTVRRWRHRGSDGTYSHSILADSAARA
jgi:hypothetical protein